MNTFKCKYVLVFQQLNWKLQMEKGTEVSQPSLSASQNNLGSVIPNSASTPGLYDPNLQYPTEPQMNQQIPPEDYDNFSQPPKTPANTMYPQPQPQYLAPPGHSGWSPYPPQLYYFPPHPQWQQPQQQGQGQQQQYATLMVAGNNALAVVQSPSPYLNFTGALVLSCISFWLCGFLCGFIAFILAGESGMIILDRRSIVTLSEPTYESRVYLPYVCFLFDAIKQLAISTVHDIFRFELSMRIININISPTDLHASGADAPYGCRHVVPSSCGRSELSPACWLSPACRRSRQCRLPYGPALTISTGKASV